jgi:hypothetical protein
MLLGYWTLFLIHFLIYYRLAYYSVNIVKIIICFYLNNQKLQSVMPKVILKICGVNAIP